MLESGVEDTASDANKKNLFCDLCKIELPNVSSMQQHILGQKHKKLDSAEEERKRVEQKCGFSPNITQDVILNYFSKYGKIIWVHFGHLFVLLDYTEPSAVVKVMEKEHYLGGRHLMIRHRQLKKQTGFTNKADNDDSNDFIQKLKDVPTLESQVQMLIQNLQPHMQQQFPKYRRICEELYNILSVFPHCYVHPFGSTITGLNFNNSDIDVFISGIKRDENDVPYLYKTRTLLLNSQRFSNAVVIRNAKIPILKCVHIKTGIRCDINLKNMLGVCNSQLINYYLNIDSKIRKLMMVLKYWAKVHKFTGQSHLFSNYSLSMMLIFFLQQEPYNIPSVLSLQQNPNCFRFHDGWNGGFQQIPVNSTSVRDTSLLKLLEKFFTFYVEFEYGVNIICPYLGETIKKDQFRDLDTLPNGFDSYKEHIQGGTPLKVNATICVQDPFEHSRNITPIVSASTLDKFVSFCRLGKKLCEDDENTLLYKLLTVVPSNLSQCGLKVQPEFSQFSIPMRPSLKYIEEKIEESSNRQEAIQKAWFKSVVKFTTIVLKDFLKFDLTDLHGSASKTKNNKNEGQADVYDKGEMNRVCYRYQCVGKINLWQARKSTAKNNKSESDTKSKQSIIERRWQ
ncbi:hypothetical protein NQ314_013488 [Rhamnusium bicolor]|uniref:Speckle targeted PIP5K1A-regulated poly(A) polymerase n=1 Tax=Rhamnusium bicolor TaxID=1586634 RepID=A0AAV8X5F3_9CUCU|nr:hypothetical protein NQ314_013488 [Rhamnusium bicolor]